MKNSKTWSYNAVQHTGSLHCMFHSQHHFRKGNIGDADEFVLRSDSRFAAPDQQADVRVDQQGRIGHR